jgi:hypothetical protein
MDGIRREGRGRVGGRRDQSTISAGHCFGQGVRGKLGQKDEDGKELGGRGKGRMCKGAPAGGNGWTKKGTKQRMGGGNRGRGRRLGPMPPATHERKGWKRGMGLKAQPGSVECEGKRNSEVRT